ncbi:MAG: rod shape-determining protein RodA [Bacteroidota bacterium]
MTKQLNIFSNIDKPILILYLIMIGIGWLNIFAAEYTELQRNVFSLSTSYGKQLVWIFTGILLAAAVWITDVRFFTGFARVIYFTCLLLLIAVLIFGVEINATKAWFRFGGFAFQPSEIAKYGTALMLASLIGNARLKKTGWRLRIQSFLIILIPAGMVFLQKDLGTTLVFAAFILVLFREGLIGGWVLFFGGLAILLFVLTLVINEFVIIGTLAAITLIIAILMHKKKGFVPQLVGLFLLLAVYVYSVDYALHNVLQPHHRSRIEVLVQGSADLQGSGYNLHQSKIAIGSGGAWGKGFLEGTQTQLNFIPEQTTDFIFCTIGEEWGFAGSTVMIALFMLLLIRLLKLAERQKSTFSRVFGYSVVSILFVHFTINIGMTIGLVPVIGIPLPLISYGGSSLWGITLMIFTFLKLDAKRMDML